MATTAPRKPHARITSVGGASREELLEQGRNLRKDLPRSAHAEIEFGPDRADPIAILETSNATRVPELVPIRYGRMLQSPFTFFRGSPAVMAWDLARTPNTGLKVQACGDAHLLNFGAYASPERRLVFDLNDFDETLPAPWEWDLKRLTASCVVAARTGGLGAFQDQVAESAVRSYVAELIFLAERGTLDIYYSHLDIETNLARITDPNDRREVRRFAARSSMRTSLAALDKLTKIVDGKRVIVEDPPLVVHFADFDNRRQALYAYEQYRRTLADDRRHLLDQFEYVDAARKVVGVGSVGMRAAIVLLNGRAGYPLFLQLKQAEASVLEPYAGESVLSSHGERVVVGQRLMQATSDVFLGWVTMDGADYYVRQLRDMKGSVLPDRRAGRARLAWYAGICGMCLAKAHARSLDPGLVTGYVGAGGPFIDAMVAFAKAYADQNEKDYAALQEAVSSGRVEAITGR